MSNPGLLLRWLFWVFSGLSLLAYANSPQVRDGWEIDAASSRVDFTLHALHWIGIEGGFTHLQGTITPEYPKHKVEVRVSLASLTMNSKKRREWALSEEFFDAENYPEMHFSADFGALDATSLQGELQGMLTLRGHSNPVTLKLSKAKCGDDSSFCSVMAEGKVSRRHFGMKTRRFTLADTVELRLYLVLKRVRVS